MNNFYDFAAEDIKGNTVTMDKYRGNLILVVNTASYCGFTKQYAGLEKMYRDYKNKGFTILAFPCNQFGGQEPGAANEILSFCETNYNISFPIFNKINVNGANAHPLFDYLKTELPDNLGPRIKWNFTKFIIDRTGKPVKRFSPDKAPEVIARYIKDIL